MYFGGGGGRNSIMTETKKKKINFLVNQNEYEFAFE